MTTEPLTEYFESLERLKKGRPHIVSKGTKITNDSVSLEAGRKKGSIKKSRDLYHDLIAAIDAAAKELDRPQQEQVERYNKVKQSADELRSLLDAAVAREVSLIAEIFDLKKKLSMLTGEKVVPILPQKKRQK